MYLRLYYQLLQILSSMALDLSKCTHIHAASSPLQSRILFEISGFAVMDDASQRKNVSEGSQCDHTNQNTYPSYGCALAGRCRMCMGSTLAQSRLSQEGKIARKGCQPQSTIAVVLDKKCKTEYIHSDACTHACTHARARAHTHPLPLEYACIHTPKSTLAHRTCLLWYVRRCSLANARRPYGS